MSRLPASLPSYLDINNIKLDEGDSITQDQYDNNTESRLDRSNVASNLFPNDDPVGQKIRMGSNIFTVLGLVAKQGRRVYFYR